MCIEFFSTECHTIKAKVIIMAKEETKIPLRADDNWEWKHPNYLKRGKRRAAKLWLVLVLHLIGWESGASFFDQSQREVKQNQSNPWLLSTLNWTLLSLSESFFAVGMWTKKKNFSCFKLTIRFYCVTVDANKSQINYHAKQSRGNNLMALVWIF